MDKTSYKHLFETYYASLCNLSYRIVGDIDKAEDIVQDVFVKIWNDKDNLDDSNNIKSYIFTMAKNRSLEVLRREGIASKMLQNIIPINPDEDIIIDEAEAEKYQLIDQLYVSIRQLPPKCGEVFTLSKVNGLSYIQIADQLNISIKTVENHMGKAFKLLREMMGKKS